PGFAPDAVPIAHDESLVEDAVEGFAITAVNTGVPHAVAFVEDVDAIRIDEAAPPIRHAEVFPEGANVTFATPTPEGFDQRTYERGVEGETRACGTGAVAIAAVADRLGTIERDESVTVSPPGGDLRVTIRSDGTATLRGPTTFEFADVASEG
ncbi:MAG TPA: diaminopimelate epimerase, partial [Natrialbaceae archaeon]|nr:diaminopimelate epimerase [Natrialbaceae archaeon]